MAAAALLAGCSATAAPDSASPEPGAHRSGAELADGDARIMEELGEYTSAWNRATAPVVEAYLDTSVGADAWATLAGDALTELRPMVSAIDALTIGVTDATLRGLLERLADSYRAKLGYLTELKAAVEVGDVDAEQQAASALTEAGLQERELAEELISYLRRYEGFDAEALIAAIEASHENLEDAVAGGSVSPEVVESSDSESAESFDEVWDATEQLYVEVPSLWSDIDRAPFDDYPGIIASNDRDGMFAGNSPGVMFSVVAGGQDHQAMMEDFRPYESCASIESEAYDDNFYEGVIESAMDCGTGWVNDGIVIVASPPADDMTLIVVIQFLEGVHDDAVQRIVDTFQVVND